MDEPQKTNCTVSADIFVADAPRVCASCQAPLCLRKQVLNLAVGNVEDMLCLSCLSAQADESPAEFLASLMIYVAQRQCFAKEWKRYPNLSYCPDPTGCVPDTCFNNSADVNKSTQAI